jgi:hypothetical protein
MMRSNTAPKLAATVSGFVSVPMASKPVRNFATAASSTARTSPSFEPKWCTTSAADVPASSAIARSDVAATPCAAKRRNAASRIRARAVRSSGSTVATGRSR